MRRYDLSARPLIGLVTVLTAAVLSLGAALPGAAPGWDPAALTAAPAGETPTGLVRGPMVEITKNCPKLRYLGRDATFEIVVTNRGDAPAANVVVTDTFTGSIDFASADNNGARDGNNIVWRVGTLGAGESRTLKANFKCNQVGTVKNSATVSYCAESSAMCEMEVKGIPAVLLECVDDPDPIEVNSNVTYTIVVTNQGTSVGTNIVIECNLPNELQYVSGTGPTNVSADGKTVRFAPLPSLAPKASATYKVTAKGTGVGDVRFHVQMKTDQIETPVMETESTHIY